MMVANITVCLCHLTKTVSRVINVESRVYVTSRMVKHLYDKKPAEEFHFILNNTYKIVKYPDKIYKNKDPKRGSYCFVKKICGNTYMCSLETVDNEEIDGDELFIATVFRIRKEKYLDSYELLWSWKGGGPSS